MEGGFFYLMLPIPPRPSYKEELDPARILKKFYLKFYSNYSNEAFPSFQERLGVVYPLLSSFLFS